METLHGWREKNVDKIGTIDGIKDIEGLEYPNDIGTIDVLGILGELGFFFEKGRKEKYLRVERRITTKVEL